MTDLRREGAGASTPRTAPIADLWRRIAVLVGVSLLAGTAVLDLEQVPSDAVHDGEIARRTVRAPFAFTWTDRAALDAERERVGTAQPPVFLADISLVPTALSRLVVAFKAARGEAAPADALEAFRREAGVGVEPARLQGLVDAGFPDAAVEVIGRWLADGYGDRLVPAERGELPPDSRAITIVPLAGDRESFQLTDRGRISTLDDVRRAVTLASVRDSALPGPKGEKVAWRESAEAVAVALVRPNLFFDAERTSAARDEAANAVSQAPVVVQRGQILFREGDRLTTAHVGQVDAMRALRADRSLWAAWLGVSAFLFVTLAAVHGAMRRYVREDPFGPRNLATSGALIVLVAITGRVLVRISPGLASLLGGDVPSEAMWFLLPVAGGAMTIRLLMGTARTVAFTVSASVVCGLLMQLDAVWVVYFLLVGLVAGGMVEHSRERIAVLRSAAATGVFGALVVLMLWVAGNQLGVPTPLSGPLVPWAAVIAAIASGLLSGVVVLALVPLFELVGFVTDYRLLELASLNHPLMRTLMLRAPGTYHHSVVVGSLAEAACEAIGANGLQAKVAAYFHDIGKSHKPLYFVENQRGGANRHNDLDPLASARVIIDHVVLGVKMAEEHRLPKPILDNIRMHHGTGLLQYFHARAVQNAAATGGPDVDDAAFRYPGPKPNTREAGVIMLADKVEAATRTVRHPTEHNLRAMIDRIIGSVMADGQFSDCPLTFREIYTIADTFLRVLMGIHHQRIEYPQTASLSGASAKPREIGESSAFERGFTLELDAETVATARASSRMWTEDPEVDEDTDYESVKYLPGDHEGDHDA